MRSVDYRSRFHPCRILCLVSLFLSQLAWILPFYLVFCVKDNWIGKVVTSPSFTSVNVQHFLTLPSPPRFEGETRHPNITKSLINSQGFAGPFTILGDTELAMLPKIRRDWEGFWTELRNSLVAKGFAEPSKKTCFIWLPDCHRLAKHVGILDIVKSIIGPTVLLHGMTIWQGRDDLLEQFHVDGEASNCGKALNVLVGSNLRVINRSHALSEKMAQQVLRHMRDAQESSLTKSPEDRAAYVESALIWKMKSYRRKENVGSATVQIGPHDVVIFHSKLIYRIADMVHNTGLLLQFASADCKIRDMKDVTWGLHRMQKGHFMLPVMLVSGEGTVHAVNDLRSDLPNHEISLATDDSVIKGNSISLKHFCPVRNITVYAAANSSPEWQEYSQGLKFYNYGVASTTVLDGVSLDFFIFAEPGEAPSFFETSDYEQVIVVVSGVLLYYQAALDVYQYWEMIELVQGSAVRIPSKLLHALVSASPETAFISFCWNSRKNNGNIVDRTTVPLNGGLESLVEATEGRTITIRSGQAYDPDNQDCDVIVVMIHGALLQILPSNTTVQALEVILVPAGESCLFWNVGNPPVTFFAAHLCRFKDGYTTTWNANPRDSISFGAGGKIMRKRL